MEEKLTPVLVNGEHLLANGLAQCKDDVGHLHALSGHRNVSCERQVYDHCALWILPDFGKNPFLGLTPCTTYTSTYDNAVVVTKTGNVAVIIDGKINILSPSGETIRTFGDDCLCICSGLLAVDMQGLIWCRLKKYTLIAFTEQGRPVRTKVLKHMASRLTFHPDGRMIVTGSNTGSASNTNIVFYDVDKNEPVGGITTLPSKSVCQSAIWFYYLQVHHATGRMYILIDNWVMIFTSQGHFVHRFSVDKRVHGLKFIGDDCLLLFTHDCVQVMSMPVTSTILSEWPFPEDPIIDPNLRLPLDMMLLPNGNAFCVFFDQQLYNYKIFFYGL